MTIEEELKALKDRVFDLEARQQRLPRFWSREFVSDESPSANQSPVWNDSSKKWRPSTPVQIAGQLGGTTASPTVIGITETGGPTALTLGAIADGQLLVRSGSTLVGTAASTMKAPQVMTPASLYSVGADIAAFGLAAPASATWATANRAIYIPFWLPEAVTLTQIFWYNGATAAGNTDAAIFNEAWSLVKSTGSTAMSGTNAIQAVNVADTALAAGRYYLALNNDSTTDTFFCWTITAAQGIAMGMAQQAAAFPLPNPAVPATYATTRLPIVGFTIRTFV